MNLKIEYLSIDDLKVYEKNARKHAEEDIDVIKNSIKQFGFNDPIGIWGKNNIIVEGHGRFLAAKELKLKNIPVVRLDHLTDDERRSYALIHNRSAELSEWDFDLLGEEITDLKDITDFNELGFDFDLCSIFSEEKEIPEKLDPSLRYNTFDNIEKGYYESNNYYGIPEIKKSDVVSDKMVRFCDWKEIPENERKNYIAHFYYDDYKFIQAWKHPDKYIDRLKEFKAVVAPNFSLYTDFPRVLQILSCYKRNWVAKYWYEKTINVIPQVVWGDKESFNYCFLGIPKKSVVSVSTLGILQDNDWNGKDNNLFLEGYNEMLQRLEPTAVLFYGSLPKNIKLKGNIIRIPTYYELKFKKER